MPGSAALFVTCVADLYAPDAAVAAVGLLREAGCAVSLPEGQTCCGQPAWNAGFVEDAARVARTSLEALDGAVAAAVVVPAGSCTTMMRLYWPDLFERVGDEPAAAKARQLADRLWEFTELLAVLDPPQPGTRTDTNERNSTGGAMVAYHRSCHMERELGIRDAPVELLGQAGCSIAEWAADDRCCGFGGTFSIKLPEVSVAMADEKLDTLPEGVDTIVGADSSCLLHLAARAAERGVPVTVRHVAEVLADPGVGPRAGRGRSDG